MDFLWYPYIFEESNWIFSHHTFPTSTWTYRNILEQNNCPFKHCNSLWCCSRLSRGGSCHPHPVQRPPAQGKLTSVTAAVHGDHWHIIGSWPHPNTHPPYFLSDPLSLCDRHVFQTSTKFNAVLFCWLLSCRKHTSCMIIHLVGDNKQPSIESYYPL